MFEEPEWGHMSAERTAHKQIPPASIRIQSVKTRTMKNLQGSIDLVKAQESNLISKK